MAKKFNTKPGHTQASDNKAQVPSELDSVYDVLLKGFGGLLYGESIENVSKLENFGKGNSFISLYAKTANISSIMDSVTKPDGKKSMKTTVSGITDELLKKVSDSLADTFVKKLSASLKNDKFFPNGFVTLDVQTVGDIKSLIEFFEKSPLLSVDSSHSVEAVSNMIEALEKLSMGLKQIDITHASESIQQINKFFANDKKLGDKDDASLALLFENVSKIKIPQKEWKSIKDAVSSVNSIIEILNFEDKKINKKRLIELIDILDENGPINKIIEKLDNLRELTDSDKTKKSINSVDSFLNVVTKLGEVGLFKLFKSKLGLKFIKNYLVNDIKDLIKKVQGFEKTDKDLSKSFAAINGLFASIIKLGEIGPIDRQKMKMNIKFIRNYIIDIFKEIISAMDSADDKADAIEKQGKGLKDVIDSVFKIIEIDKAKQKQLKKGTKRLKKYISDNLADLFDTIRESLVTEKQDKGALLRRIEYSKEVIEEIATMADMEKMPSLTKIVKNNAKLLMIEFEVDALHSIIKNINKLPNIHKKKRETLEEIFKIVKDTIQDLDKSELAKLDSAISVVLKLNKLSKLAISAKLTNVALKGVEVEADIIKTVIDKLSDIDPENIKKSEDAVNAFTKLVVISAGILIVGALAMKFVKIGDLAAFTLALTFFLFTLTGVFSVLGDSLKESMDGAKDAVLLVAGSAFVMLLGSYFIKYINIADLITFTLSLSVFLFAICGTFRLFSKGFQEYMDGARDAMLIVATSALILFIGAKIITPEDFINAILFTVELTLFLCGIGLAFKLFAAIASDKVIDTMYQATILIAVSGGLLLLAGVFVNQVDFARLLLFEAYLLVLVGGTLAIYWFASKHIQKAIKGLEEFAILVAASGLILILGGLVMNYVNVLGLLAFTITLGIFVGAMIFIYSLASANFKRAMKGASEMVLLITVSAAILLIGGWIITKDPSIALGAIAFGVILGLFVWAITSIYSHNAKNLTKAMPVAIGLAILTAVSAAALLIGGKMFIDEPNLSWAVPEFAIILGGYVFAMAHIAKFMGAHAMSILKGEGLMAGILAITFGAVYVISKLTEVASDEAFGINMLKGVLAIGGIVLAVAGIATGLGALLTGPQLILFELGLAYMAEIGLITLLVTTALKHIGEAVESMKNIGDFDTSSTINAVKGIIDIAYALDPIKDKSKDIIKASFAIQMMSIALSRIAKTIKDWAELKIPVYEGTKIVGYHTIEDEDFTNAATNIKTVVKTLGQAVIDVYNEKPELFKVEFGDLFTGGSPFAKVAKSLQTLGPMLSSIAKGIKEWAQLRIPVYQGTKIVGYHTIESTDFTTAATNIQAVIMALGGAVIDTYLKAQKDEKTKGMFDIEGPWELLTGGTPFAKVVRAMKTLGPMLSSIAQGVKEWSDLRIPVYKDGKIVDYQTITDANMQKVGDNIYDVLTCLGDALIYTIGDRKDLFGDNLGTDAPVIVAANAMKMIGETLSLTANAVASYASGKFPVFDKDGKFVKDLEVDLSDEGVYNKAAGNIETVLTCLGNVLKNVISTNKEIFKDGVFEDSPAAVAAAAIKDIAEGLNSTLIAISKLLDMNLDDLHTALDPNGPEDNVYHKLEDLLMFTGEVCLLFTTRQENTDANGNKIAKYGRGGGFLGIGKHALSFAEYLNKHNKEIKKAGDAIGTFTTLISDIITKFGTIGKTLLDNQSKLNALWRLKSSVVNNQKRVGYIEYIMGVIDNIISILLNESHVKIRKELESNKTKINNYVTDASAIILKLLGEAVKIKDEYDKVSNIELNKLEGYINTFNLILDIVERTQFVGKEGFELLKEGILKLYAATGQIEFNEKFRQHAEDLNKYVESINKIDITRINSLKGLVDSMNALSMRLGDLDSLTNAISDKLSGVLLELVNQLRKADASIKNAHDLQKKRKELIEKAVKDVKEIMKQKMIVEISQKEEEEDTTTPTTNTNNTQQTGSGNDKGSDNLLENGNTETEGTSTEAGKVINKDSDNNSKPLTRAEFERLMKDNMKGWRGGNRR